MGAEPGTVVGSDLALGADEEFGAGRIGEEHIEDRLAGILGEEGDYELGLESLETLLVPIGADQAIDEEAIDDVGRLVLFGVSIGHCLVVVGVFAGEGDGGGIDAVFQGVEAGDGLALGGAGSGRTQRIGAVRG